MHLRYFAYLITILIADLTEADVRRQLADSERAAIEQGGVDLHETTASGFLTSAMMLEETQ